MRDPASGLRRTLLPRTPVNKGKKRKGRRLGAVGLLRAFGEPALLSVVESGYVTLSDR